MGASTECRLQDGGERTRNPRPYIVDGVREVTYSRRLKVGRSRWAWFCVGRMGLVYVGKREDAKSVV